MLISSGPGDLLRLIKFIILFSVIVNLSISVLLLTEGIVGIYPTLAVL